MPSVQASAASLFSSDHYLDILPAGTDKGEALSRLCGLLGIPLTDTVAAGDEENDLSMILAAGTGIMAVFGSLFNAVYLLPAFAEMFHMPLDAIVEMGTEINSGITGVSTFVLLAVAPLNLLKGLVVSLLTMLLYKRVQPIMFKRS